MINSRSIAFEPVLITADGYGNHESGWDSARAVIRFAQIAYRAGREAVEHGRPAGVGVYKIRVRACAETRAITPDWRARDVLTGQTFDLIEVDALSDRAWVWITAQTVTGVPQ